MNKKIICLFILITSLFFVFSSNVKAITVNSLRCIYNFPDTSDKDNPENDSIVRSIMITQENGTGDMKAYYSYKDVEKYNGIDDWHANCTFEKNEIIKDGKKSCKGNGHIFKNYESKGYFDISISDSIEKPLLVCPKFANVHASNARKGAFIQLSDKSDSNSGVVTGTLGDNKVVSNLSENAYGNKCSNTKVDWISTDDKKNYDVSCLYQADAVDGKNNKNVCLVTQISINKDGTIKYRGNYENWSEPYNLDFTALDGDTYLKTYALTCPSSIGYMKSDKEIMGLKRSMYLSTKENDIKIKIPLIVNVDIPYNSMQRVDGTGSNNIPKILKAKDENYTCKDLINDELRELLSGIITLIRVLVPIILIAMGVVDFGSAIFAGDEEKIKKAQSKFIKRLLIGAAFFLVPVILKFILGIAYNIWGVVDPSLCGLI